MRAVRLIGYQSATVEGSDCAHTAGHRGSCAKGEWATHAITLRTHVPILCDGGLFVEPGEERFRIRHLRSLVQTLRERPDLVDGCGGTSVRGRRFFGSVEGIDHKH